MVAGATETGSRAQKGCTLRVRETEIRTTPEPPVPTQSGVIQDAYRAHEAQLFAYLMEMLGSPGVARDVSEATFAHVQARYASRRILFPRALLCKIATTLAVGYLQRRQLVPGADFRALIVDRSAIDSARGDGAEQPPDPERLARCVAEVIKCLWPALRKVFVMAYVEGKCHKELAASLGISEHLLERRMTRALATCRSRLHSQGIDLAEVD